MKLNLIPICHNKSIGGRQPVDRFWRYVHKTDGCWEWTGSVSKGYGQFFSEGGIKAHRFSWFIHFGLIPNGLIVCHHCDNPRCVRPDHLFLGTVQDNAWDASFKGRLRGQRKTHCKRGHEFTPENTRIGTRGGRACVACGHWHDSRRNRSKKALAGLKEKEVG